MSAKEQYKEFLDWLTAKREEIAADYWDVGRETQKCYRRLLIAIQCDIWETQAKLRRLQNA